MGGCVPESTVPAETLRPGEREAVIEAAIEAVREAGSGTEVAGVRSVRGLLGLLGFQGFQTK
ncbi:hypothetical protein Scani_67370 [Streptomyces caniferus]|uniref:Uncharacterized protein n=1 Tax=Streptomyces caniferus TaxID=285557 RepID=A0A640SGK5_9ACTN|nr:hypothetical protein Scani_67370 [Streptomyces caniferus]